MRARERAEARRVAFFMPCEPPKTNHQDKKIGLRFGKGGAKVPSLRDSSNLVETKRFLDALLLQFGEKPKTPLRGPLEVRLAWTWPYLAGESKRVVAEGDPIRKDTSPDLDNLTKTLVDRLAANGYIVNDGEISDLSVSKRWGARPGIGVWISEEGEVDA